MAMSVSTSILLSVGMCCVTYVGYHQYEHRRDMAEAAEVMDGVSLALRQSMPAVAQPPAARQTVRLVPLTSVQRCVGGVVVAVSGSTYTQTGLRCDGIYSYR